MSIVSQGLMYMPSQRSFLSPGIILVPVDIPVPSLVVEVFACLFVCWSILSLLFPSPRWNGIPPVPKSNSNCCSYPHKNMPMYHKRKKGRRESRESLWFLLLWLLYSSPPDFLWLAAGVHEEISTQEGMVICFCGSPRGFTFSPPVHP